MYKIGYKMYLKMVISYSLSIIQKRNRRLLIKIVNFGKMKMLVLANKCNNKV